jgi:hypothetical protein
MPQSAFEPWPSCQMSVMTPHAAATLITLSTTALAGRSSERNARARSRNENSAISPIISGKLP